MKPIVKQKRGLWVLRTALCGILMFSALSFTIAQLTERSVLPMDAAQAAMYASLALSSLFAGTLSGGAGRRGLLTGTVLSAVYLAGKLLFHFDAFFTSKTLTGLVCILPAAWLGSCIFHKKQGSYTKRNRKNRRRNYK